MYPLAVYKIQKDPLDNSAYLFKSRIKDLPHLSTRQYSRIVDGWINSIGLEGTHYGTHTMRRTKASLIDKKTRNIRACQLILSSFLLKIIKLNSRRTAVIQSEQ